MTEPDAYTEMFALCSAELARLLTDFERDAKRKPRKQRVLDEKLQLLRATFPDLNAALPKSKSITEVLRSRSGALDHDQGRTLLVDLSFSDGFAPYELEVKVDEFEEALKQVATTLGYKRSVIDDIARTRKDAGKSHAWKLTGRHLAWGVLGLGIFAAGGWFFAPALGAALGGAAGLSGVAATNFGLALLGGGSLAAGGAGVAGGMILVTGVSAGVGAVAATGASVMLSLGARGTRAELIKLQTTFKVVLLSSQTDRKKAQRVISDLSARETELRTQLTLERKLNDDNARRVKEIEETIEHVQKAVAWMKAQKAAGSENKAA